MSGDYDDHVTCKMSAKEVSGCPICGKLMSKFVLTKHANSCLDKQEFDPDNGKCTDSLDHENQTNEPPSKRVKYKHVAPDSGEITGENDYVESNLHQNTVCAADDNSNSSSTTARVVTEPMKEDKTKMYSLFKSPNKSKCFSWDARKENNTETSDQHSDKSNQNRKEKQTLHLINSPHSVKITTAREDKRPNVISDTSPLAEQLRPNDLSSYIGQHSTVGRGKLLRELLETNQLPSLIFWGPPGCGKTTLARIVAKRCKETHNTRFAQLSATTAGIADVKEAVKIAKNELKMLKRKTILFIDEIHRFNKLQQDSFLPHVEDGTVTLIGATTENPSFQVNNALLSRCRVIVLEKLSLENIIDIIKQALQRLIIKIKDDTTQKPGLCIHEEALQCLANFCDGDARGALNGLETLVRSRRGQLVPKSQPEADALISVEDVKEVLQRSHVQYDRAGDEHYHCASALQKSIRGSDANGAIYWMTRMFEGGEDPLFIARRLLVCASEDVGLADANALPIAMATFQACHAIGKPECAINLAHCTTYLARAPKSYESTAALQATQQCIKEHPGALPGVPLHLRNATSSLSRQQGYGKGYKFSHLYSAEEGKQEYLPSELRGKNFFSRNFPK